MRTVAGGCHSHNEGSALVAVLLLTLTAGSLTFRTSDEQGGTGQNLLATLERQAAHKSVTSRGPRNDTQAAAVAAPLERKTGTSHASQRELAAKCSGRHLVAHLPQAQRALKSINDKLVRVANGTKYDSCAVVGNSGNMQATAYGAVIDSHQAVIRLNQAPTETYEVRVGGKATYRVINKEWVKKYTEGQLKWLPLEEGVSLVSRGDAETRVKRGTFVCVLCIPVWKSKASKFMSKHKSHPILKISPSLLSRTWHMVKGFVPCSPFVPKKCPDCKPSSGILAVSLALSMCDNVSVYGMAGTRFNHPGGWPYHYYSFHGTELAKGYSGHMFEVEKELVAKLAADSILTMCGPDNAITCDKPHWRTNPCCQNQQPQMAVAESVAADA